jgi:exopolysaccharide biosynthesis polyprenyl glycosylphosphotransferase
MTTERPFLAEADGGREGLLAAPAGHQAAGAAIGGAGAMAAGSTAAATAPGAAACLPGLGRPASPSVLPVLDLLVCCAVLWLAADTMGAFTLQARWVLFGLALIQIALFALFLANGLYDRRVLRSMGGILKAAALPGAVAIGTSAAASQIAYADRLGTVLGTLAVATCGAMISSRVLWLGAMRATGRVVDDPVVLVGSSDDVREFLQEITPEHEIERARRIVGYVATDAGGGAVNLPRLGRIDGTPATRDLLAALPMRTNLIVVTRDLDDGQVREALPQLFETCFSIRLAALPVLRLRRGALSRGAVGAEGSILIQPPSMTQSQWAMKRILDVSLASLAVLLLGPLLLLIAAAIKLDSPGPVFFRQVRHGMNNRPFRIYKFRTMHFRPEARFEQARRNDPRVTRLGAILRKTSIDELPQLLNVIGGTMSLVGPRPHPVELNESFAPQVKGLYARHRLPPGITGLAQVNHNRGETATVDVMQDRVNHDLRYVGTYSLVSDVRIILLTFVMLWRNKDVY